MTSLISQSLASLGELLTPYLSEISTALIACVLVMIGGEVNAFLRKFLRSYHFIVRTIAFVLINAFGYGLIIVKVTPKLSQLLISLERGTMFCIVFSSFIVIGIWAQRNRQI